MRARALWIVLAAAIAVVWLALAAAPRLGARAAAVPGSPRRSSEPGGGPAARAARDLEPGSIAGDDQGAASRGAVDPAEDVGPRVTLRGRIESSRTDLARAVVDLRPQPSARMVTFHPEGTRPEAASVVKRGWPLTCTVEPDGTFELDVAELATRTRELVVTAQHPALKSVTVLVSTEPVDRARSGDEVELAVVIRMLDEACRVSGRVTTEDGTFVSSRVTAFELSNGALVPVLANGIETGPHGEFELELSTRAHVLLAYARDWRPATVNVVCASGDTLALSPIVLERGFTIAGQALLGSAPFAAGMTVDAELERPVSLVASGPYAFAWTGERFEWARRQARSNDIGLYEITALGDRDYAVRLIGAPARPFLDEQPRTVRAPATDVELDPRMCEVLIEFRERGEPRQTIFTIRETGSRFMQGLSDSTSDEQGHATLWLSPNRLTELVIAKGTPAERVFTVPSCNTRDRVEMRIDL